VPSLRRREALGFPPPPFCFCWFLLCCFNKGFFFFGVLAPKMKKWLFSSPVLGWSGWFLWMPWRTISPIPPPGVFIHRSIGFDLQRPMLIVGVAPADVSISKIWTPFMNLPTESRSPMFLPVFFMKAVANRKSVAFCSSQL
jgi:hypothetical protein